MVASAANTQVFQTKGGVLIHPEVKAQAILQRLPMKLRRLLPPRREFTILDLLTSAEIVVGGLMALVILRWLV